MGIKHTLASALQGESKSVNELCKHFKLIAVAYLRMKAKKNRLLLDHLYKDIDDLALDCIADLFGLEDGCLKQIGDFICPDELSSMSESDVNTRIRRLVFSKVNEGLFRNYSHFDSSLSRIIRNLKRNLEQGSSEGLTYDNRSGMILSTGETDEGDMMPDELLEIRLTSCIGEIRNTVDALHILKRIFRGNPEYAGRFGLVNFAVILRKGFALQFRIEKNEEESFRRPVYLPVEVEDFLKYSIRSSMDGFKRTYIRSGKMDEELLNKYIDVCSSILRSEYIAQTNLEGYYDHFNAFFPDCGHQEYRSEHRTIVEYMMKKLRSDLVGRFKNEEKFSRIRNR